MLTVVYEIFFASSDDSDHATRLFEDFGFAVETDHAQVLTSAPHGLRATIQPGSEEEASAKLHDALAGIPHDPVISYQEQRLTSYTPG